MAFIEEKVSFKNNKYLFLGTFRFTLAIIVLLAHLHPFINTYNDFMNWAGLGVWLFFVVSGYVIFAAHDLFYQGRVKNFIVNRCLRIYPTLWLCLFISLAIIYLSGKGSIYAGNMSILDYGIAEFLMSISIIGGFLSNSAWQPLSPAFTLTIEMKFYVAAATLFFLQSQYRSQTRLLYCLASVAVAISYLYIEFTGSQYRFFGALRFSPLFMLGAALYIFQKSHFKNILAGLAVLVSFLMSLHLVHSTGSSTGYSGFLMTPIKVHTSLAFSTMIIIFMVLSGIKREISRTSPIKKFDAFVGNLTYPVYLIQLPIISLIMEYWPIRGVFAALFVFFLCVLAATIIHLGFERPFSKFRNQWRGVNLDNGGKTAKIAATSSQ